MQNTDQLLMIEPVNFGFNAETAVNNSFQADTGENIQQQALQEFNDFVNLLRNNKMHVTVIKDTEDPFTPDSIFPNNWISFHDDGSVFLYPMYAANRRNERKVHILEKIKDKFEVAVIHDLSNYENENIFLEGTGSMILDRENRIVYACISPRTDQGLLNKFCEENHYKAIVFSSTDMNAVPIYHTNVMMCVGKEFAVVCLESITDENEKARLIVSLHQTQKEIIEITLQQLNNFAGNMLQVINEDKEPLLIMSSRAYLSLTSVQVLRLEKYSMIIHSPLDSIETAGGGSARCMIAEVFNRPK